MNNYYCFTCSTSFLNIVKHIHFKSVTNMNRVLIGVAVLWMILLGIILPMSSVGYAQENDPARELLIREINVYRDALSRILDLVVTNNQYTSEARSYLSSIESSDLNQMTLEQLRDIRDTLMEYFDTLKDQVKLDPRISEEVQQRIISEVSNVIQLILQKYNKGSLRLLYKEVKQSVAEGDVDKAMEVLEELDKVLNEVSVGTHAETLISEVLEMLREYSKDGNISSGDALNRSINNILSAIDVLMEVKSYLISINASEESILALDLAISTLNSTVSILEEVKAEVGDVVVPGEVGRAMNNTMLEDILNEIAEYRWKIEVLFNESYRLENLTIQMNKTYLMTMINEARETLGNASQYLNMSESAALAGNLTEAFHFLNKAKVGVEYAEDILEDVAKILDTELEMEEQEKPEAEKFPKLVEDINELRADIQELMDFAHVLLNNTDVQSNNMTLSLVQNAISYLNNASTKLDEALQALNMGNYTAALSLYREAYTLYENAEHNLDMVQDWVEESDDRDILNSMMERVDEYRDEISELKEKANFLYDKAVVQNNSDAAQLVLDANEKLNNASNILDQVVEFMRIGAYNDAMKLLDQVAMLIADAKSDLNQAAAMLNVNMEDGDEDESSDDGEDDSDDGDDNQGIGGGGQGDDNMGGGPGNGGDGDDGDDGEDNGSDWGEGDWEEDDE